MEVLAFVDDAIWDDVEDDASDFDDGDDDYDGDDVNGSQDKVTFKGVLHRMEGWC